jgi:hypothetical protein
LTVFFIVIASLDGVGLPAGSVAAHRKTGIFVRGDRLDTTVPMSIFGKPNASGRLAGIRTSPPACPPSAVFPGRRVVQPS